MDATRWAFPRWLTLIPGMQVWTGRGAHGGMGLPFPRPLDRAYSLVYATTT